MAQTPLHYMKHKLYSRIARGMENEHKKITLSYLKFNFIAKNRGDNVEILDHLVTINISRKQLSLKLFDFIGYAIQR